MAIKQFRRLDFPEGSLKATRFAPERSVIVGGRMRIFARSNSLLFVALGYTDAPPDTAEFERDLQTFKDLCALTDPPT